MEVERFLIRLLEQSPSLALCGYMLWVFSRDRRGRDEALAKIGANCHEHSERVVGVMEGALARSNVAIQENTKALGACIEELHVISAQRRVG